MPTISMFYGILVLMYFLEGSLPRRQLRMVQVWVDIHREDLLLNWDLAVSGEPPFRIAPLS